MMVELDEYKPLLSTFLSNQTILDSTLYMESTFLALLSPDSPQAKKMINELIQAKQYRMLENDLIDIALLIQLKEAENEAIQIEEKSARETMAKQKFQDELRTPLNRPMPSAELNPVHEIKMLISKVKTKMTETTSVAALTSEWEKLTKLRQDEFLAEAKAQNIHFKSMDDTAIDLQKVADVIASPHAAKILDMLDRDNQPHEEPAISVTAFCNISSLASELKCIRLLSKANRSEQEESPSQLLKGIQFLKSLKAENAGKLFFNQLEKKSDDLESLHEQHCRLHQFVSAENKITQRPSL